MSKVSEKIIDFLEILKNLEGGIKLFNQCKDILEKKFSEKNELLFGITRDAMIKRFTYGVDLFLKLIKIYLEGVEKIILSINSPRIVIREAVKSGLISELEGSELMDMVDSRNKTSHTYHEAIADDIANKIPHYYNFMKIIVDRMQKTIITV